MSPHSPIVLGSFSDSILHVDGDAFFTSVAQALDPSLRGKPVVTGRERGIVVCASYEAKALGVRRPTRLSDARKICPGLIALDSDFENYSLFSKRMFEIMRRFTPVVEESSIDEGFAELSGLRRVHRTGYAGIGRRIKEEIQKQLGLTVSVGLGASKTLAKVASSRCKPDGFTVAPASELHHFLPTVPVRAVCGFGPNTSALLEKQGVRTAWDFVSRTENWARSVLGKIGGELWRELRGESVYEVDASARGDRASVSRCRTFAPSADAAFIHAQLLRNLEQALIKLRRYGLRAGGLVVYLKDRDFKTRGMEAELDRATSSTLEAAAAATALFEKIFRKGETCRQTGVILSRLEAGSEVQSLLFEDPAAIRRMHAIDDVIDRAARRWGNTALHLGSTDALQGEEEGTAFHRGLAMPVLKIAV